tara:strand:+ start:661 stop:939 length:279 start_codon:yes stop_codon:yes gene_type:complete
LSFEEAICLVFKTTPSNLSEVFWQYTLEDIKMSLRLYLGERQSEAVQYYESLLLVAGKLFGSEDKGSRAPPENTKVASTKAEIMAGMTEIFG